MFTLYLIEELGICLWFVSFAAAMEMTRWRHHPSSYSTFLLLSVTLLFCGLARGWRFVATLIHPFDGEVLEHWTWEIMLGMDGATFWVGAVATWWMFWYIPKIMKVPSVEEVWQLDMKIKGEIADLNRRISSLPDKEQRCLLQKTLESVKQVKREAEQKVNGGSENAQPE